MNKIFILFYKYRAVWEVSFQNFSFCNFHIYHLENWDMLLKLNFFILY